MTRLLQWLFGRLPIGWLQLTHNRPRFAAALAGVAFANVLVFVQLGIMNSMATATMKPYGFFQADIMISASDANALAEGDNVARQWLFQALADPDVIAGTGIFVGNVSWARDGKTLGLTTFGVDPTLPGFLSPVMARKVDTLQLQSAGLLDMYSRGLPRDLAASIRPQSPLSFEVSGTTLTLYDTFAGGGGFGGDGYMMVSDQTFLTLFPARSSAAPDHILLQTAPGADPDVVAARLRDQLSDKTLRVRSFAQAAADDLNYQQTKRPTGIIFGFGVIIGVLVGIVIVYQVLSTDVADHLGEYATFKAMGYRQRFFLGIVFEQALILAVLGFLPGVIVATGLLAGMKAATTLPLAMTPTVAVMVFFGTLAACSISGAIATRKLASADPADLF
ncbi:MAG: ABC-type antimicrobial peptide transport system permease component [Rhodobacteraceae bacterium]|uniref:ABC transporter permease DevC n=1 Tax=Cypionkella sp. TaxID=2811411 RepID=UPI001321488B|nr:ABC transporter permease DevC [Cypionkella sp.]KAF0173421.1 MAG: ABC-type antimicrobial peptide transport system permease component [Paracoccaceae bacterium]MDO8326725.1 ABC transporter permease DevC [Cypionkella sp.]